MPITGYFTKVEIPTGVKVGEYVPLSMGYYAKNVGAAYWSSCIMAKMGTDIKIVVTTKEIGQEGGWSDKKYNLQRMPSTRQVIYVKLFGHNEAGHVWTTDDWQ